MANKLVRKIQMSCIKPIKERKIKPQKGLKFYLTKEKGMKEEINKLLHSSVSFVFLCLVFESQKLTNSIIAYSMEFARI